MVVNKCWWAWQKNRKLLFQRLLKTYVLHFQPKSFQEHLLFRIFYSYKHSQSICRWAEFSQIQILQLIFNKLGIELQKAVIKSMYLSIRTLHLLSPISEFLSRSTVSWWWNAWWSSRWSWRTIGWRTSAAS